MIKRFRSQTWFSLEAQKRIAWCLLLICTVCYAFWISDQSVLRYDTFRATGFDLGNMSQATWNTLHGRPFEFTNHGANWYGAPIRLAQHVEPIFFLLSLLYVVQADPRILLVFQTLAMALGALPVFLLTRRALPTLPLLAAGMAAGYLFAPALLGQNLFDFHPVALATPLLLYAVLAITYRRYVWCVLACVLAAACKEEMPLVVALFGVLVIWKYRQQRLGLLLMLGGVVWSALAFLVVMPHFNVGAQHNTYWYRYAALGSSPAEAVVNVLTHPWILIAFYVTLDRVYYLASLLRSTGFLALLAPEWLLPTLPSLAINLLTAEDFQHSGVFHYNAAIIAFMMLAAIHGLRRLVLYWYGLRDEAFEYQLYREPEALGLVEGSAGKPIPGVRLVWGHLTGLCRSVSESRVGRRIGQTARRVWAVVDRRGQRVRVRLVALARVVPVPTLQVVLTGWLVCMIILNYIIMIPLLNIFWADHRPDAREQRIVQLLALIPPDAAVSAGGTLNPHLSARRYLTVFPEVKVKAFGDARERPVDYIIVDLDKPSPEDISYTPNFLAVLNQIQRSGQYKPIAQAEGVILLARVKP